MHLKVLLFCLQDPAESTHNITKLKDKAKISANIFLVYYSSTEGSCSKHSQFKKAWSAGHHLISFLFRLLRLLYNNFVGSIWQLMRIKCEMNIWIMFSKVTAPFSFMDLYAKSVWGWFIVWCNHRSEVFFCVWGGGVFSLMLSALKMPPIPTVEGMDFMLFPQTPPLKKGRFVFFWPIWTTKHNKIRKITHAKSSSFVISMLVCNKHKREFNRMPR